MQASSMSIRILFSSMWAFSLAVMLSACQAKAILLPDGQISLMSKENSHVRARLTIASTAPLGNPLPYHPVATCLFLEERAKYSEAITDNKIELTITNPIKDWLQVIIRRNNRRSTYTMSNLGELSDINAIDPASSKRVTRENYKAISQQKMKALRGSSNAPLYIVNEFSLVIPQYSKISLGTGNPAAWIYSEDGIPRAGYEYRGTTVFNGVHAAVFDLLPFTPMDPSHGPPVIGFSVVDLITMLPLLVIFDSYGSKYSFQRLACSA